RSQPVLGALGSVGAQGIETGVSMGRALVLSLVALLVIGVLPVSAAPGAPGRGSQPGAAPGGDEDLSGASYVEAQAQQRKHPALASELVGVGQQARAAGRSAALSQAQADGVAVRNDQVRVEIQSKDGNVGGVEAAVTGAGGVVERSAGGLVQALVPPGGLEQ